VEVFSGVSLISFSLMLDCLFRICLEFLVVETTDFRSSSYVKSTFEGSTSTEGFSKCYDSSEAFLRISFNFETDGFVMLTAFFLRLREVSWGDYFMFFISGSID